ncbi:MAG: hypothetical protein ABSE20_27745 [Acetobacteraceae bacterium]
MHTETGFTIMNAISEITQEVIETVADRPGDSPAKRFARQQSTAWTMMSFLPRDPVEAMLAGHCVVFDNLLRDTARDALCGQPMELKRRTRSQSQAFGKLFLVHIEKFDQRQARLADQLAAQSPAGQNPAGQNPAGQNPAGQSPPGKAALSTSGVGAPPEAAPRDAAPRNAAAPDPAEAARQPPPVEPAARATAATKVEAPSAAVAATPPGVQTVTTENAKIGTPRVGGTAPPAEPPALAQTDQPRPATTPVAQPAVAQPAVAPPAVASPAVADAAGAQGSGQPMAPAPSGGTDHARPGVPPVQPKPGTQTPSPAEAELAQSGLQPNQAPGGGRQAVALAMLAASHGVSHSPGQVGQTSQAGQPHAAVRAARVEEPV